MRLHHSLILMFAALVLAPALASASITVSPVRIIYDAGQGEASARLFNNGRAPDLVQSWLDRGDADARDGRDEEVPFIVSPPLARIDPGKSQVLRIVHSGEPLPQDRESVFWLNVLAAPPQSDSGGSGVQFPMRTRIKMIYRPAGLAAGAASAHTRLSWQLAGVNARPVLRVSNPTPYHISFSAVELVSGGRTLTVEDPDPLAPFATRDLALPPAAGWAADARVRYRVFNDYGGGDPGEAALPAPAR
uniref:fimbrial biogenesis chaperone n=1 Tax=Castellaniella defragrans TaxID=75697 RepID=UPI00334172C4